MRKKLVIIITAFVLSLVVITFLSFLYLQQLDLLIASTRDADHSYKVMNRLDALETLIKDIDRLERGYMITKDSEYVRLMYSPVESIQPVTDELSSIIKDDSVQYHYMIWVKGYVFDKLLYLRKNIMYSDTSKHPTAVSKYYYEGNRSTFRCVSYLSKMKEREKNSLKGYMRVKNKAATLTTLNVKYIFYGFSIITISLFILMVEELIKRVRYQNELQDKLIDLKQSHDELKQIAFVATHDLQEPLRKIMVFSNLLERKRNLLDEEGNSNLERITRSAERLQQLVGDLANLTSLVSEQGQMEYADLNELFATIKEDHKEKASAIHAEIRVYTLPAMQCYPAQLKLMFSILLENALKFSSKDILPLISVKSEKVNGEELSETDIKLRGLQFYCISFSDNGIGFDNRFAEKIFQLFQRLHNQQSDYEGKGVGLAIAQRVMANHKGYILAHGHPNAGATFKMYFPAD